MLRTLKYGESDAILTLLTPGMGRISAIAKFHASQTAKLCADKAQQIFGGYGMASEYRVSWLKSYADLFFTGEGSANVQKILIAEDALGYKIADRHHGKTGLRDVRK